MDALNNTQKYAASHRPATRLGWPNSTLLGGDVPATVAELKQASSSNLVIMGSGELIGALMAADLIDECLLMIHPFVLGTGRRLFPGADVHLCGCHGTAGREDRCRSTSPQDRRRQVPLGVTRSSQPS
jgi:dihydrofolate reductase